MVVARHKHGIGRRIDDETLIGGVGLELRVEGDDDLGTVLADGGDQHLPGRVGDVLCLLDPGDVDALNMILILALS